MSIERCRECRRPFEVREIALQMPGTRDSEEVACPHCGHTVSRRSSGVFRIRGLSSEQEAAYEAEQQRLLDEAEKAKAQAPKRQQPVGKKRAKKKGSGS